MPDYTSVSQADPCEAQEKITVTQQLLAYSDTSNSSIFIKDFQLKKKKSIQKSACIGAHLF